MKKTAIILSFTAALITTGCGVATDGKAKAEEAALEAYIRTIDSTTQAIREVDNAVDFGRITKAFAEKAHAYAQAHQEADAPKPLLDKAAASAIHYQEAVMAKIKELAAKEAKNFKRVEE